MIKKKKKNDLSYEEVYKVFTHIDYQNEFKRYQGRLTLSEFIDYF